MTIGTYDTHDLIKVFRVAPPPVTYWLDLLFGQQINFTDEFIDFEQITVGRRLAPFVSPMVQGKPMYDDRKSVTRFKPAYLKPKDPVNPSRLIKRRAGEAYGGSLSPAERRAAVISDILVAHRDMHIRRHEWMACKSVVEGAVTISGEDYPTQLIDFGRAAAQSVVLSGTDLWTDTANSDPVQDLEDWVNITQENSGGYAPTRATIGTDAWKAFKVHPKVVDQLDTTVAGLNAILNRAPGDGSKAQYKGRVGTLEIWVYSEIYETDVGVTVPFMSSKDVVLTSSGVEGVRCFGAILDGKAGYQSMDIFPKIWSQEDPAGEFVMSQGAPLMVPGRPNATFRATVVA